MQELENMISGINSDVKPSNTTKRSKSNFDDQNEIEDEESEFPATAEGMQELLEDLAIIKLPHQRSEWVDSKERNRISYTINLPSGIKPEHVLYRVVKDGRELQIELTWPQDFADPRKLLHKENEGPSTLETVADYYPKLQGYRTYMKSIKNKEDEPVDQIMMIQLPLQVETHIPPDMVKFKQLHNSSCCCVEIDLVEVTNTWFVNRGSGQFKI